MRNDLDPLILDLLEWIDHEPRSYAEVIEAWRTSCPRLTVWEDCVDRGLATREHVPGREVSVKLTDSGRDFLRERGRTIRNRRSTAPEMKAS
jgi:hypothetical protein